MAGKHQRTAAVAFGLITDLVDRLMAAGLSADQMPTLEQAVAMTWPLARHLEKLERRGRAAGAAAFRARETLLSAAVAGYVAAPWLTWPEFDPGQWHVELQPGAPTRADRERQAA